MLCEILRRTGVIVLSVILPVLPISVTLLNRQSLWENIIRFPPQYSNTRGTKYLSSRTQLCAITWNVTFFSSSFFSFALSFPYPLSSLRTFVFSLLTRGKPMPAQTVRSAAVFCTLCGAIQSHNLLHCAHYDHTWLMDGRLVTGEEDVFILLFYY